MLLLPFACSRKVNDFFSSYPLFAVVVTYHHHRNGMEHVRSRYRMGTENRRRKCWVNFTHIFFLLLLHLHHIHRIICLLLFGFGAFVSYYIYSKCRICWKKSSSWKYVWLWRRKSCWKIMLCSLIFRAVGKGCWFSLYVF